MKTKNMQKEDGFSGEQRPRRKRRRFGMPESGRKNLRRGDQDIRQIEMPDSARPSPG